MLNFYNIDLVILFSTYLQACIYVCMYLSTYFSETFETFKSKLQL